MGESIEGFLEEGRVKEAWYHLARWQRQVQGKQVHTTREGLDQESVDMAELYICSPPARIRVPILVQPASVNDDISEESEIEMDVWGMNGRRSGSLWGTRAEALQGWRKEAKHDKDLEQRRWELMVRILQVMFRYGTLPEEIALTMMFFLLKEKG